MRGPADAQSWHIAVDELVALGADVRIAFDPRATGLYAKAWVMERPGGTTTAFIGSSNLTRTALFEGRQRNVRVAQADAGGHRSPRRRASSLKPGMTRSDQAAVVMYTLRGCPHCLRARLLLRRKRVSYREIRSGELEHGRQTLVELTGGSTFPQIVIGDACIGGAVELAALQRSGELDRLLAAAPETAPPRRSPAASP